MRRRVLAAVLVAAALSSAAVLALLGRAVLAVPDTIRAEDARLARADLAPLTEIGPAGAFGGAAEELLGAGDDQSYREALRLYHASRVPDLPPGEILELHGEAEATLTRLVRGDGDPTLRSRAANLLGVLLLEDARLDPASSRRYLETSLGAFQDAVKLDPAYADAKHNLELLATLPPDRAFKPRQERGSDASVTPPADEGY